MTGPSACLTLLPEADGCHGPGQVLCSCSHVKTQWSVEDGMIVRTLKKPAASCRPPAAQRHAVVV